MIDICDCIDVNIQPPLVQINWHCDLCGKGGAVVAITNLAIGQVWAAHGCVSPKCFSGALSVSDPYPAGLDSTAVYPTDLPPATQANRKVKPPASADPSALQPFTWLCYACRCSALLWRTSAYDGDVTLQVMRDHEMINPNCRKANSFRIRKGTAPFLQSDFSLADFEIRRTIGMLLNRRPIPHQSDPATQPIIPPSVKTDTQI